MKTVFQRRGLTFLVLPTTEGRYPFPAGQIIRLESLSNYTFVHFKDRKPLLVARVLRDFDKLLSPFGFIRTHRSHLVNTSCITGFDTEGRICLSDTSKAEISRRKKSVVLRHLTPPGKAA